MRYLPMRRSKLVGTEGPGSLVVSPEGETAVVGSLDLWFRDLMGNKATNTEEFEVIEPRLKSILKIDKFYKPPEFRKRPKNKLENIPNCELITPLLRFPKWHYCVKCKTLRELELDQTSVKMVECSICQTKNYKQVPFVVVCEEGHLSDFPWRKWVHGDTNTECLGDLRINSSGGTTLDSWVIECVRCSARRNLKGVTASNSEEKTSFLGDNLNKSSKESYTCEGGRPWCGEETEVCNAAPVAMLKNSINVYMARQVSALAIPGDYSENVDSIVAKIQSPNCFDLREELTFFNDLNTKAQFLRKRLRFDLDKGVTDREIEDALLYLEAGEEFEYTEEELEKPGMLIKQKEFEKLAGQVNSKELKVEPEWINVEENKAENYYAAYIKRFSRVSKLKETTALYGFDRKVYKSNHVNYEDYYPLLYKDYESAEERWLPVNEAYGEGIFLQLDLEKIEKWESSHAVQNYFNHYLKRISHVEHREEEILRPRNVMLHTLTHFLINELANTCGYNRAAIKERLYLDEDQIGVLIYISSGDSMGTLGGLVRLGLKGKFFQTLDKAINDAEWCSSDPVCTELGEIQGQGIDGLNGAACYNCSHIPETSCEYWNLYLDRVLLIDQKLGYFKS